METKDKIGLFFYHVFLFGGGLFYVLVGMAVTGFISMGFHRNGSVYESVINQVNPELESRQQMALIDDSQKERTSSSMKRLGVK